MQCVKYILCYTCHASKFKYKWHSYNYNDNDNDNEFYFQFVQVALYYTIYKHIYN